MQLLQGVKSLGRPCKYIYICDMCRQGLTPLYEGQEILVCQALLVEPTMTLSTSTAHVIHRYGYT